MKLIAIGDNVADTFVDMHIFYLGDNCVNVAVDALKKQAQKLLDTWVFSETIYKLIILKQF